jgi:hypothetical protein
MAPPQPAIAGRAAAAATAASFDRQGAEVMKGVPEQSVAKGRVALNNTVKKKVDTSKEKN